MGWQTYGGAVTMRSRILPHLALLLLLTVPVASSLQDLDNLPRSVKVNGDFGCDDEISCAIADTPLPDGIKTYLIIRYQDARDFVCTSSDPSNPGVGIVVPGGSCRMVIWVYYPTLP